MKSMTLILERDHSDPEALSEELSRLPGVVVLQTSKSFVDLEVEDVGVEELERVVAGSGRLVAGRAEAEPPEPVRPPILDGRP